MYEKLKQVLSERGISYAELARQTGISQPDMTQAINGVKPMWNGYKQRISNYLELFVNELFEEE